MKLFLKLLSLSLLSLLLVLGSSHGRDVSMVTVDWAPYYGGELPDDGVITVLVKKAFERVGHNATITFVPWKRALQSVERGQDDIVMGAYYNEERKKTYYYSDPFYGIEVGLVALKELGLTQYSSLQDLKPYKIGVSRGFTNGEEFDSADYLQTEEANNQVLNIRKLFAKRVDLITIAFGIYRYEVYKLKGASLDQTVFLDPPLMKNSLYLMMSLKVPDHKEVIGDFNRGLAMIKKDGTYDKVLQDFGF